MRTPPSDPDIDLQERLSRLGLRERERLQRRLDRLPGIQDPQARARESNRLTAALAQAEQRTERRRQAVPAIAYPDLPVSGRREEILEAIRTSQVVVVAGETGSGKTTQLPKMCLELGRGVTGLIGHTQPRRIAARTVAERVAEELGTPVGGAVGYTVRFSDHVGADTLVRVMTDGILLAEIQRDRMLSRYDTLILDEAHERSLNIDFLLGYLAQLLPRRPDLKVVITSATIDPERFSQHFGNAPIVEVSGRTYPVEVRYRPLTAPLLQAEDGAGSSEDDLDDDAGGAGRPVTRDQTEAILAAVEELRAEPPGDVLVFLSGEREIRDTADALRAQPQRRAENLEILPLYARLSAAEQHRVFSPHPGRRIVLATNVAETSLTVPGIRYVVDPGTARISRYSLRTKVQRLPIEPISQASANQRAGRCGRVADGVCIRLYSWEDFESRPEFTDPEILRTNLASVILQMTSLGLGDIAAFPFLEPPDRRQVRDGVQLLEELGALDPAHSDPRKRLTPLGRQLAQLPVDPRLGRMVLEAHRNGCVREVMIIAAALSIQDPRERPADAQQAADDKHRRFADETSDFLGYLNLWAYLKDRQRELSSSQFRRLCRTEYLHYLRVREWQDLVAQLRQVATSIGVSVNVEPAAPDRVHTSLLAGLLSHIGVLDSQTSGAASGGGGQAGRSGRPSTPGRRPRPDYLGARGARFALFRGSALSRKPPQWVVAAELVETSRLWARTAAKIDPAWVEELASHLVKRTYSEPHWSAKRGAVMAFEKVTLYGIPVVAARKVGYATVDPELCREMFIRHALVQGEWRTHHRFLAENRALLEEVGDLEHRARRRDLVVDDEALFDFYDARVGPEVVSTRHFDAWWKQARRSDPDLLSFSASMLLDEAATAAVREQDYPDSWRHAGLDLRLTYQFEPGSEADGVTVHVPLPVLNQVGSEGFDWQVPGMRAELVTALVRSLPKPLRVQLVPAPDTAAAALAGLHPQDGPLAQALSAQLARLRGVDVPASAWQWDKVPDHLRMTFQVEDERGRALGRDKDLDALRQRLAPQVRAAVAEAADDLETSGLTSWTIGTLPRVHEVRRAGQRVTGYPALVDEGDSVAVRVLPSPHEQQAAMLAGTRRLLLLTMASPLKALQGRLTNAAKLTLSTSPHADVSALLADCVACAVDDLVDRHGGPAWDEDAFTRLRDAVRSELDGACTDVLSVVEKIVAAWQDVDRRLRATTSLTLLPALSDLRGQLSELVHPGFVAATGRRRLPDVLRYLRGMRRRLETLPDSPERDRQLMARVAHVLQAYREALDRCPAGRPVPPELAQVRWMLQELRVSFFAQQLGTPAPVSEKRVLQALARAAA